ncbi:hypothetical protein [Desulfosporosinus sp. FKA]|uniref:hypothetical protein n=1 Tax=Desulfosporosinus sp. FKA TaxID=1969834 RepID=UPI000B4992D4|nr:hypothetical protein [Desulfosporosinus sp. FKA]
MFNSYDLNNLSLVNSSSGYKEFYVPLWIYSSGYLNAGGYNSAGNAFVGKGTVNATASNLPNAILHKLSSSWSANTKFALECSFSGQQYTNYIALWDLTSGTIVSSSQISTTSTTMTSLRSSQFTLIPGHNYGITFWNSNSYNVYISKAHLVAIMS